MSPLFRRARRPPRLRPWQRVLLLAVALPLVAAGLFCLSLAYKIYAANEAAMRLTTQPAPQPGQRILVFAPHPDDETLGAAGMMRQARLRGDDVRVVLLTNGDGFRVSAQREFHEVVVTPQEFVRYGVLRQREARTALAVLGIPADHVYFLGYPDRGLMPMWTDHWAPTTPVLSGFTAQDHSPYDASPTARAPYSGATLLADITRQMEAERPTDIYVTHPNDDHPDHAAASAFVRTALAQLRQRGIPWAQTARLHFYLVHRGDWPTPQGLHEDAPLLPPGPMAALDTHWAVLPLSHYDVERKYAAIERYHSQVEITSRFLLSFARRNELFGTLDDAAGDAPALARVPDGRMRVDAQPGDWAGLSPVAEDPQGDSVVRAFQSGADAVRLFACRDSLSLYVRMDTARPLSSEVAYTLTLRPVLLGPAQPAARTLTVTPTTPGRRLPLPGVPGGTYAWRGNLLEMAVPLPYAGLGRPAPGETLYLRGETHLADVEIDTTGFRPVACDPPPASSSPARTAAR